MSADKLHAWFTQILRGHGLEHTYNFFSYKGQIMKILLKPRGSRLRHNLGMVVGHRTPSTKPCSNRPSSAIHPARSYT